MHSRQICPDCQRPSDRSSSISRLRSSVKSGRLKSYLVFSSCLWFFLCSGTRYERHLKRRRRRSALRADLVRPDQLTPQAPLRSRHPHHLSTELRAVYASKSAMVSIRSGGRLSRSTPWQHISAKEIQQGVDVSGLCSTDGRKDLQI
jgi:hypothetical protein